MNQEQVASSIKVCLFYNSINGIKEVYIKFKVSVSENIQSKVKKGKHFRTYTTLKSEHSWQEGLSGN